MRVVSLLPSATEILFAVGAGADVVGVTHECDYPAAAAALAAVTASVIDHQGRSCSEIDRHIRASLHAGSSIYRLDERQLADLAPDLIVTQELCDVCAVGYGEVVAAARRLPGEVPVISLEPHSIEDVLGTVTMLGDQTGHSADAAAVVASLRGRLQGVKARTAAMSTMVELPRVACIEWTEPLMVAGHWVPEMVGLAGGVDVLGRAGEPSRWIEWDELIEARPDVVVFMPCGFALDRTLIEARAVADDPRFARLPAAAAGRTVAVDGSSYFNRPGPRIVDGVELLFAALAATPGQALPPAAGWITP